MVWLHRIGRVTEHFNSFQPTANNINSIFVLLAICRAWKKGQYENGYSDVVFAGFLLAASHVFFCPFYSPLLFDMGTFIQVT